MKKIFSVISSTRTMALLLLIFGVSIATATFIENDYGTDAARSVVYNAVWFELLLTLGAINILGVTIAAKMYQRSKLTLLIFHLAFIVILIGAGITRFTGTEGAMYIREGETSDSFLTSGTSMSVALNSDDDTLYYETPVLFSDIAPNRFRKNFTFNGKPVTIRLKAFHEKAEQVLAQDDHGGPHARVVLGGQNGRQTLFVAPGDSFNLGNSMAQFRVKFDSTSVHGQVSIFMNATGSLSFVAPFPVIRTAMTSGTADTLTAGRIHPLLPLTLHYFQGSPLVLSRYLPKSKVDVKAVTSKKERLPSVLLLEVGIDGKYREMTVTGIKGEQGTPAVAGINGTSVSIGYGSVRRKLPFAIHLNDFIIERYPGSGSPSWFESRVELIDINNGISQPKRIYMNNILNYKGYRLYQSSYDPDEQGSVLSVNHDGLGTVVTYFGYLCLAIGFVLSLLNRNSRFVKRWNSVPGPGRHTRITVIIVLLGFSAAPSYSLDTSALQGASAYQNAYSISGRQPLPFIDPGLAREFDTVLVQDVGGRIEPMNTLSSGILRKVIRKETYKGQTAGQIILGMLAFPQYWLNEPMISVNHPAIQKALGISGNYASFNDFFRGNGYDDYIFSNEVEEAYRKKPAYRTKYDNELMRADERLNICSMIYSQRALKIFPYAGDENHTWYSPVTAGGVFTTADSIFAKHVIDYLVVEIRKAESDHHWDVPVQLVKTIKTYQENNGQDVIPPARQIKAEIVYNNSNLFVLLMRVYMITGFILLLIQFFHMFRPGFNLRMFTVTAFVIILSAFLVHLAGLGLRWYVSGHAPWSNGYEALTFIAWATVLSGLIFSRKSGITLSATAILASLILMVAHLS
ncbi:MAG TPA: cytochrome c biogenesis protein ResB, partial [Bacteroidales bacterium]|nr:cytochrome c biogenesis protein ResB [Bacteroidales bacterium]